MSLLTLLRSHAGAPLTASARHMLLLSLTSHVLVTSDSGAGSAHGSSSAVAVGASVASSVGTAVGTSTAIAFSNADGIVSAVGSASGSSDAVAIGAQVIEDLPDDIIVEMGLGGSYRAWLNERAACERHWQLGDVSTVQARDEMSSDASGDGIYLGDPESAYGMLPEYGLAKHFDGVDDRVSVSSGLTGIGGSFSIAVLVRPAASGLAQTLVRTGPDGAAILGMTSGDVFAFGVYGGSGTKVAASIPFIIGRAYSVVGTYDGSAGRLYVMDLETGILETYGPVAMSFTTAHGVGMIGAEV